MRFALASYNVGLGHVLDGRRLARELGLDPNRWYGNVEETLPLLRQPVYAAGARYGYCRCVEPVAYVAEINNRYLAYSSVID
jgi:membrane-bound lytic murein transglycosylase F